MIEIKEIEFCVVNGNCQVEIEPLKYPMPFFARMNNV